MYILENIFLHDKKYPMTYSRIKEIFSDNYEPQCYTLSPLFDILAYLEKIL